ncbi:hypothetical protein FOL47_004622 [Perkinsus chesapeaki]|uniref:Uncharacterized protein n=1 Tax=Perkinsus chesapeaki TaxID=330153 RepID=A0A7J6M1I3_PERCH|nr:hypothetical protein FOL47_004622 [Perkinsus chesapeaki]
MAPRLRKRRPPLQAARHTSSKGSTLSTRASKKPKLVEYQSAQERAQPSPSAQEDPPQTAAPTGSQVDVPELVGSADSEDWDDQTKNFLLTTLGSTPVASNPQAPVGDTTHVRPLPNAATSSFPGHLMSPAPYKKSWLSSWIEQPWYAHIPPGFLRMKDLKFSDSHSSQQQIPLTAVLLAGQVMAGRLQSCSLISYSATASCVGSLCDSGFGPNGTVRAKYALETILLEIHSAVLDGRVQDVDLANRYSISPQLEQIFTKATGFTALPPPASTNWNRRGYSTKDKEWWSTKNQSKWPSWDSWSHNRRWSTDKSSSKEATKDSKSDSK